MTETAFDHVRVLDVETTGFPPGAQVVEVAFCDVVRDGERWLRGRVLSSLINPGIKIPATAMAVHHITDEDVKGARPFAEVLPILGHRDTGSDEPVRVYAAHKADFEREFYNPADAAWICTWRCAVTAWPDAPGFGNQVLRYWLGLKLKPEMCTRPHRAPDDAYVTAAILVQLLKTHTVEQLIEISAKPVVLPSFYFGMHSGVRFDETRDTAGGGWEWSVPTSYLEYIIKQPAKTAANPKGMDPDARHTAFHHLNLRRSQ